MPFPFEVPFEHVERDLDQHVDAVFSCLESKFLLMPKGPDFIEYSVFEAGYESLKKATRDFHTLSPKQITGAINEVPVALIVLRTILGLSPSEWAYLATEHSQVEVTQSAARGIERRIRAAPLLPMKTKSKTMAGRILALVTTACVLLERGAPKVDAQLLHRLDKVDTAQGSASVTHLADFGIPFSVLLYERYLGRPFASHRDSVSELVGDSLENVVEQLLLDAGVSHRRIGRAEQIPNFDQAPDFVVPNEFNPQIVIEAKLTEDDGTARDKVTRVQHLAELSHRGEPLKMRKFEVVAAIEGRGFKVRREDMKKLLIATRGKVFTSQNLDKLIEHTRIAEFRSRVDT